jgi:hypothetical protein
MIPEAVTIRDIVSIIALFVGPVTAVFITLQFQRRKEARDSKMRLFMTLMSHRRAIIALRNPDWVTALNLIDIVFSRHARVVELWHQLYAVLHTQPLREQESGYVYLKMLSAMAEVLGFRQLQQVEIDKFYLPEAYQAHLQTQTEIQTELLRALKNTERFVVEAKKD